MKIAVKTILKAVKRITDTCSEILLYKPSKNHKENLKHVRKWSVNLRRFTRKIRSANRKYRSEVLILKAALVAQNSNLPEEIYDFFLEITQNFILYVNKLTKSIKPFLVLLKNGRGYLLTIQSSFQRADLLRSMKAFKNSIEQVMNTFFRVIDRTRRLELINKTDCDPSMKCKQQMLLQQHEEDMSTRFLGSPVELYE